MRIGFYTCDISTGRNSEFPFHKIFSHNHDWPERILKRRGLSGNCFFQREATKEEIEICKKSLRAWSQVYRTVDEMIKFERVDKVSEEDINKLLEALEKKKGIKYLVKHNKESQLPLFDEDEYNEVV